MNEQQKQINKQDNDNYFVTLQKVKCDVDKKMNLNYISWAEAWTKLKTIHPDANYEVRYNHKTNMPYFSDDNGGFVCVSVGIPQREVRRCEDIRVDFMKHHVWMPILDNSNKPVLKENINSFLINKSIQRALVKAIAMHGLGLYVYNGEDVPKGDSNDTKR